MRISHVNDVMVKRRVERTSEGGRVLDMATYHAV